MMNLIIDKRFGMIQIANPSRFGRNVIGRQCDKPIVNIPTNHGTFFLDLRRADDKIAAD